MTRAGHDSGGASSSHAPPPPPPPPPPSDVHHAPWVPTYSSPPVIGFPVFDPSRIGSEYATPPSYQAPSSYHSQSFYRHSAPPPSGTQLHERPAGPLESAEAPQAPQPRRTTRAVRPPPATRPGVPGLPAKSASLLLGLHQIHLVSNSRRNGAPLAFTTHGSVRPHLVQLPLLFSISDSKY
ncbi:hypothetical protein PIB30_107597 [Stylosanthes scabra]|uniref:Uncharacterized protein n=1 Tax=Stylosanthes scabra TaxID=79078 RepID=A0ABU6Z243_9FABA|nr:hypothetical protein [Stylosanthes scabra]